MPIDENVRAGGVPNGVMRRIYEMGVGDMVLWSVYPGDMATWTITAIDTSGQDVPVELLAPDLVTTDSAVIDRERAIVRIVEFHETIAALPGLSDLSLVATTSPTVVTGGALAVLAVLTADATVVP